MGLRDTYWIDIKSGTWGHVDDLRIVDLGTITEASTSEPPPTPQDYTRYWQDYASDAEIAVFGEKHGKEIKDVPVG